MVQMEHVFNGKMYRGRPFYKKQNPRYGQRGVNRKAKGWSFPIIKDKKSKKVAKKVVEMAIKPFILTASTDNI